LASSNPTNPLEKDQLAQIVRDLDAKFATVPVYSKHQPSYKHEDKSWQLTTTKHAASSNKIELPTTFINGRNIWILKATGFNRGIGIHVFSTIKELVKLIKEYTSC
jgi:hypothetical protein